MPKFQVVSDYTPSGDQPQAIASLAQGVELGLNEQTLLGVTGSGKTFTMAKVIEQVQRPTLVLAHNKTLAAQLCAEFKEFFPNNAVEYFVSYYDYYQPEAYIPHTDTFIEKDSAINDEIERLRHSATSALFERRDVIVVASVSCIYGLGDPIDYANMVISLRTGQERPMEQLLNKLTEIRYERNDLNFVRNAYRVRGDTLEVYPAYWSGRAIRIEFFGDEIEHSKPAPDVFLKAKEKAGARAEECLVLEDSDAGIHAAYAAGIPVICIPDLKQPSEESRKMARLVLPSLLDVKEMLEKKEI